jgi:hypothetical protein
LGSRTIKIVVRKFGVDNKFAEKVLQLMNDCYNRIDDHAVEIVDLYLFDKSSSMIALLSEEKRRLGIGTSAFEASFFAVHDAWRGIPRIMVAYNLMSSIPKLVSIGGLRHEVAHTVLHGSLEYYTFSVPVSLLNLKREYVISEQVMRDLLYLVSIAVKDYEVTRLLYEKSYVEDQVAYNKYFLEPSEKDHEAWSIAKKNKNVRPFVLASLLKPVLCATPLLKNERYGKEIAESISKSMSYLPTDLSTHLVKSLEVASKFGENTQENVVLLTKKFVDNLVEIGEIK